jgi:ureidoacrylate peracid hydrolase
VRTVKELQIEPGSAGLIIELMQNDNCHPDGIYARNGVPPSGIQAMVPTMARVADACRAHRIPVIATRLTVLTDLAGRGVGAGPIAAVRPFLLEDGLRAGAWGNQVIEELQPADYEVRKWVYSSFYRTELEHILTALQVRQLVFMGVATDIAVESTAREAIIREYDVTVLSDCVSTYDPLLQAGSLNSMARLARVMTAEEFLAHLPGAQQRTVALVDADGTER